ncbi:MAG TPA: type III pantothenate kinase [Steroidobacteraceae bacterium]
MLLVDIGNTRVKWAACSDGVLEPQQAAEYAHWTADDWQRNLIGARSFERAVVASVAGEQCARDLTAAAQRSGIAEVRFIAATAAAGGVRNAYPDPRLLGVDRWVAVIGAYHLCGGACCVVDVGTAATVDAVDASGRHLGGYIVPGPHMMVRSLHAGTRQLASHTAASGGQAGALLADNTREAIERGCRIALAALVDRAHGDLARATGAPPALVLTGGAAAEIQPWIAAPVRLVPDLVLRGLAWLAQAGA